MNPIIIITIFSTILVFAILAWIILHKHQNTTILEKLNEKDKTSNELRESITRLLLEQQQQLSKHQLDSLKTITEATDKKLQDITNQVNKRLSDGFEKTNTTFTDVVKRLALIDEAQKKITELSSNVLNLQEVLTDKRSRGAFGEVQLSALIHNVLPKENFSLQYTLSNDKRVDCILFLPEPTGNITIDAKFPLESYQKLANPHLGESERNLAQQQFKIDIKKHIQDIAEKYIIPEETADGAMMFIPAEAIFAEIHGHYPELVELSHRSKVWMVSPSTLMAILTTARAVIKDSSTRKQIHIIQEHLITLSKDFTRFQTRMDNLTRHISQAHADAEDVNKSAKKISTRFSSIEKVELVEKEEKTK